MKVGSFISLMNSCAPMNSNENEEVKLTKEAKKHVFLKDEFSNEMFWNFLYIVFIVPPYVIFFYVKFGEIWIFESA